MTCLILPILYLSITVVFAQMSLHPVSNFCKRWSHQSTYENGKIYLDGGNEVFTSGNEIGYNTYMLVLDLTRDWDWRTDVDIWTAYAKPDRTPNGNQVPVVQRGALFNGKTSDTSVYLYGGSVSSLNTSFPGATPNLASDNSLFSFNPITLKWASVTSQHLFGYLAQIPNAGASVQAFDLGLAFYIGGQIDNGTSFNDYTLGSNSVALDGMIVIDFAITTAKNYSTTALGPPRTRGEATYVQSIGLSGALVYLGGLYQGAQNGSEYKKENLVSFQAVAIFDIDLLFQNSSDSNPDWYLQNATGQIPPPRVDFCMFSISAMDNSSHQIYIYGGQDGETIYDDMYQLSIPSFTWRQIFEGVSPRMHHTCHVVAGSQLITLGGVPKEPGTPDFSTICDWEYQGVAVFNINSESWGSTFNATTTPYMVSSNLSSYIGGNEYGNATAKAPTQGFEDKRLAKLFAEKRLANLTNPGGDTQNSPSPSMKKSKLIGILVGSIVGGLLFLGLVYIIYKFHVEPYRRRQKRSQGKSRDSTARSDGRTLSSVGSVIERWRGNVNQLTKHEGYATTTSEEVELQDRYDSSLTSTRNVD